RESLDAVVAGRASEVEPELERAAGAGTQRRELLAAAQAQVRLLRRVLDVVAERRDDLGCQLPSCRDRARGRRRGRAFGAGRASRGDERCYRSGMSTGGSDMFKVGFGLELSGGGGPLHDVDLASVR